jgi:hypothetical protein
MGSGYANHVKEVTPKGLIRTLHIFGAICETSDGANVARQNVFFRIGYSKRHKIWVMAESTITLTLR